MSCFEIVKLTPNGVEPVPMLGPFETGKEASHFADQYMAMFPGVKFQPRPIKGALSLKDREKLAYNAENTPVFLEYLRKEVRDRDFPRYEPTSNLISYLNMGKRVTCRIDTYVNTFLGNGMESVMWRALQDREFRSTYSFHIARTAAEIQHVYINGPNSCMAHESDYYVDGFHPARCYESPNLAVVYLKRDGRITARAVVNTERFIYGRTYGDGEVLKFFLTLHGYRYVASDSHEWEGSILSTRHIEGNYGEEDDDGDRHWDEGWAAPYTDFGSTFILDEAKKQFIASEVMVGPYHHLEETMGIAGEIPSRNKYTCDNGCNQQVHSDYICLDCWCDKESLVYNVATQDFVIRTPSYVPHRTGFGYVSPHSPGTHVCSITKHIFLTDELLTINGEYHSPFELEIKLNGRLSVFRNAEVPSAFSFQDGTEVHPEVPLAVGA